MVLYVIDTTSWAKRIFYLSVDYNCKLSSMMVLIFLIRMFKNIVTTFFVWNKPLYIYEINGNAYLLKTWFWLIAYYCIILACGML